MKLERKFYEIQLSKLEIEMVIEALEYYSSTTEHMTEVAFPEPKKLSEEIAKIKKEHDAK